jgi:hypothetical protein
MDHSSTRDTGALGELAEQLKTKGDAGSELLHLLVGKLAYFKAQARGCPAGPEMIDWIQAELEIYAIHQTPLQARGADRPGPMVRSDDSALPPV